MHLHDYNLQTSYILLEVHKERGKKYQALETMCPKHKGNEIKSTWVAGVFLTNKVINIHEKIPPQRSERTKKGTFLFIFLTLYQTVVATIMIVLLWSEWTGFSVIKKGTF